MKNIKQLQKELGEEIENNNTVNKEADDLYEKNLEISENYQKLQKKYDELYNCNKNNESKIINLEKDLRQSLILDLSSVNNNTIDVNGYSINVNGGCGLMIKDLRKKKAELENQVIELKNEIREQDEDLLELSNELKNKNEKIEQYKTLINDEKGKNYKLQKKLKELNIKIAMFDGYMPDNEQFKNSNINIHNNNNNYLNIFTNANIGDKNDILTNQIVPENFNIIKCVHLQSNNRQYKWYLFQKKKSN